ncbi:hypothetical protein E6O75_ATG04447 [Venturia nashicola]|uniref:Uncharacterized protein n=1 Tax=Venturia nashicola TaxID=86259 RepID=A0A4Z1PQS8_9PEZI|nr:hypothetical protein E6O75_ATG04447 [Venturia nashicola]
MSKKWADVGLSNVHLYSKIICSEKTKAAGDMSWTCTYDGGAIAVIQMLHTIGGTTITQQQKMRQVLSIRAWVRQRHLT